MQDMIELTDISHHFDTASERIELFRGLSCTLRAGETLAIIGPSGAGKSSLLSIAAGLETPASGNLRFIIDGAEVDALTMRANSGFIFQQFHLMPELDALGNLALPLRLKGISRRAATERVMDALGMVGLDKFAENYPRELSGGMKMRVSIARALVTRPKVMLMDEPFAALDEITRQKLNDDILRLWGDQGWTVIFVTHSVFEAVYLSSRIVVMAARPGRVIADLPNTLAYPRSGDIRTTADFAAASREVSDVLHQSMDVDAHR